MFVELARARDLLDQSAVHDGDAVAHRERLFLVVRDVHERRLRARLDLLELELHLLAQLEVERAERLVEQQRRRLVDERAREGDALLLAAGELSRLALLHALEAHRAQRGRDARAHVVTAHALDAQPERDVLEHAHVREQRVRLEHHVDVPLGRRHVRDVAAAQQDAAARGLLEARDHAQRRRLAAARRPEHREELALVDLERDGVDGDDRVEALRHRFEDDRFGSLCAGVSLGQVATIRAQVRVRQRTPRAAASASPAASRNAGRVARELGHRAGEHRADQRAQAPAHREQPHRDALADPGALGTVGGERIGGREADRLRDPDRDHGGDERGRPERQRHGAHRRRHQQRAETDELEAVESIGHARDRERRDRARDRDEREGRADAALRDVVDRRGAANRASASSSRRSRARSARRWR